MSPRTNDFPLVCGMSMYPIVIGNQKNRLLTMTPFPEISENAYPLKIKYPTLKIQNIKKALNISLLSTSIPVIIKKENVRIKTPLREEMTIAPPIAKPFNQYIMLFPL